ncbi:tetratricopeptide repeat domain-containing protein [Ditylenchus destructor]|uniref:Tetratricopeptide repeat domain-containing protein n=1 Tax=Ditylenchus destructor TaxID=166010 RepID=A0AAD4MWU0_9BILA|nr:tetratricopeptide repeat domain-containing protein [Ditylenchus destructor]
MDKKSANVMLDGLIGQANLEYARGNKEQAITLLQEAIRQAPRNVDAYMQLSDIYTDLGQTERSFEFRRLAAHMSTRTTAEEWADVAELALTLDRLEDASMCYERAIKCEPSNWIYYEKRIEILDTECQEDLAMKTRLQAAKSIDCRLSTLNFQFFEDLIRMVAEYYISKNDEEKAMEALQIFILRSKEFNRSADTQHLTLLSMWMARGWYGDCVKSILVLHDDIRPITYDGSSAIKTHYTMSSCIVEPFPPVYVDKWEVSESFPTAFLARLIVSFIRIGMMELVPDLIQKLISRPAVPGEEICYLEVGRAYQAMDQIPLAINFMDLILKIDAFKSNADAWFLYGILQQANGQIEIAQSSYENVIKIQPEYVDARINLSTVLQKMGKADLALETLKGHDLDLCSQLPDERLLIRQSEVLLEQRLMQQYVKCVRLLLIPHFYLVHRHMSFEGPVRSRLDRVTVSHTLKRNVFDSLRGTPLERLVKRLGSVAFAEQRSTDELSGNELHDYALKLAELLHEEGKYTEMLHVVCYAFLHRKISRTGLTTFKSLLLYASIKAGQYALSFEYLRYSYLQLLNNIVSETQGNDQQLQFCRIFNAMNYVFCHYQNVGCHRFVMRALAKAPENYPLHMISGNNSLITGSYRHSLGEYFRVWLNNRNDPLICLLIGLTFVHMSCKKDISSRHMIAMRGVAFVKRYQKLRGCSQEVNYNIGRMLHQLGILTGAVFFYEKVLNQSEVPLIYREDEQTGEKFLEETERYNLKRLAAHNLALIYEGSGNRMLAREILERFCTI